jgi:di/tricarboxylate transporter
MGAFAWGRLRYDLIALLSLLAGLISGIVPAKAAFDGFKNDVVVIIACALVVSAAIARSGIIEAATRPFLSRLKSRGGSRFAGADRRLDPALDGHQERRRAWRS